MNTMRQWFYTTLLKPGSRQNQIMLISYFCVFTDPPVIIGILTVRKLWMNRRKGSGSLLILVLMCMLISTTLRVMHLRTRDICKRIPCKLSRKTRGNFILCGFSGFFLYTYKE